MEAGTIMVWAFGSGFILWAVLTALTFGARLAGWATRVIEDIPKGEHVNLLERKYMEWLGFSRYEGKWRIKKGDMPNMVLYDDYGYYGDYKEGKFLPTGVVWAMVAWGFSITAGLAVLIWKITLPILLFFVAVYGLRALRRKAKAKAAEPTKSDTEKELDQRYPQ